MVTLLAPAMPAKGRALAISSVFPEPTSSVQVIWHYRNRDAKRRDEALKSVDPIISTEQKNKKNSFDSRDTYPVYFLIVVEYCWGNLIGK